MDDQKPKNLNPVPKQPQENSATSPAESSPQEREDLVFFNVMPKLNSQSSLVEPKIKVVANTEVAVKNGYFETAKKYKWYIIAALGAIIAGFCIYFLIQQLGSNAYKSESFLVKQPSGTTSTSTNQTQQPVQSAVFSTPQDWRDKYFPGCTDVKICGDDADPDQDGLSNLQEYKLHTDPNNPDSDQDGLADGDEVNVFGTDPLDSHTAKDEKYSDADFIKGGFNITTGKKMTASEISDLSSKIRQVGLRQPTIKTLGSVLNSLYDYSIPGSSPASTITASSTASSTIPNGLDESVEAKQSRDAQRSDTIKNIEIALVKYQTDNGAYPLTNDFNIMYSDVKLYLKVATNPIDPINKPPYVYSYNSNGDSSDFILSFYSEVAGQPITKNAADSIKDAGNEQASIYDNQRETDLESLRTALLLYSQTNASGSQDYVFPTKVKYKTAIVPQYISVIPVDPKTGSDYDYEVSPTFNTFTLKTPLDNPPTGTTGYLCNQDSCQNY